MNRVAQGYFRSSSPQVTLGLPCSRVVSELCLTELAMAPQQCPFPSTPDKGVLAAMAMGAWHSVQHEARSHSFSLPVPPRLQQAEEATKIWGSGSGLRNEGTSKHVGNAVRR